MSFRASIRWHDVWGAALVIMLLVAVWVLILAPAPWPCASEHEALTADRQCVHVGIGGAGPEPDGKDGGQ